MSKPAKPDHATPFHYGTTVRVHKGGHSDKERLGMVVNETNEYIYVQYPQDTEPIKCKKTSATKVDEATAKRLLLRRRRQLQRDVLNLTAELEGISLHLDEVEYRLGDEDPHPMPRRAHAPTSYNN